MCIYIYIYIFIYLYGFSFSLSLSRSFFSGGDALTFIADFDLTKSDYADLAKLYDNFQDAQDAACVWIKENPDKWSVDWPIHAYTYTYTHTNTLSVCALVHTYCSRFSWMCVARVCEMSLIAGPSVMRHLNFISRPSC